MGTGYQTVLAAIICVIAILARRKGNRLALTFCLIVGSMAAFAPLSIVETTRAQQVPERSRNAVLESALARTEGRIIMTRAESYCNSLKPPYLSFLNFQSSDYATTLRSSWQEMSGLGFSCSDGEAVLAEAAILAYESGDSGNAQKLLSCSKAKAPAPLQLQDVLRAVYCGDEFSLQTHGALSENAERLVSSGLKPGWYRDCALARTFEKFGQREKLLNLRKIVDEEFQSIAARELQLFAAGSLTLVLGFCALVATFIILLQGRLMTCHRPPAPQMKAVKLSDVWLAFLTANVILKLMVVVSQSFNLHLDSTSGSLAHLINSITQGFVFALTFKLIVFSRVKLFWLSALGFRRPATAPLNLMAGIASTLLVALILSGCIDFLQRVLMPGEVVFNPYVNQQIEIAKHLEASNAVSQWKFAQMFAVLDVCLLAPVLEETYFRGLIFGWLRSRTNFAVSGVISAALFGLVHFDNASFLSEAVFGFLLAFLYEKDRSLCSPILCHIGRNFYTSIAINTIFSGFA